ncbi:MAG TPA: acetate/propionate family kinase [Myxococcales bacterium]|nr:acetate/propionate family kinase [Myxococcales bacterium]
MILVVNAGSSSLKFSIYEIENENGLRLACKAQIDGIGGHARLHARDAEGAVLIDETYAAKDVPDAAAAMERAGAWLRAHSGGIIPVAVGHRVVHGGPAFASPVAVDDAVFAALERLVPLAPLHQPQNLAPIRIIKEHFPGVLQVACFDTAYHRAHPEVADRYALPEALYREGVCRYGFHGLSYEYIARTLPRIAPEIAERRVVVAHLGSGASMCATRGGRSVDTTMGFTALDGLPMGTRCGQLDPGVVLYLLARKRYRLEDLEHLLYHQAGLLALSGLSNDVRDLLQSREEGARLALEYFVYRAAREIGSLAGALGGIDALVFTAGIGENSPEMRARICARSEWLGLQLDDVANRRGGPRISSANSRISAWVIPTDEERMIAEHTLDVFRSRKEET